MRFVLSLDISWKRQIDLVCGTIFNSNFHLPRDKFVGLIYKASMIGHFPNVMSVVRGKEVHLSALFVCANSCQVQYISEYEAEHSFPATYASGAAGVGARSG